jgi:hypothetical protein
MFVHSTLLCWVVSFRDVLFREGLPYRHLHRKCRTIYLTAWGNRLPKGRNEIIRVGLYWFAAGMFSLNHFISLFFRFWKKFERSRFKVSLLQNVGGSTWIKTQDCGQWGTLLQISFVHYLLRCSTPTLECETLLTVCSKKSVPNVTTMCSNNDLCSHCCSNVFQQWPRLCGFLVSMKTRADRYGWAQKVFLTHGRPLKTHQKFSITGRMYYLEPTTCVYTKIMNPK